MSDTSRIERERAVLAAGHARQAIHEAIDEFGLSPRVVELVQRSASSIDHDLCDLDEAELAALAWTEALSSVDRRGDYAAIRSRLRRYFTESQIGALTSVIVMLNLWNRHHESGC